MLTQEQILDTLKKAKKRIKTLENTEINEPIAILGMACRLPGKASTPEALWEILISGEDCIQSVPKLRWLSENFPNLTASGYFIENIDQFDAEFFNISPREAQAMDPQQRILLEVSWEALERAAQSPEQIYNQPVGIFIGASRYEYAHIAYGINANAMDAYNGLGNFPSLIAGRIAYHLGTTGPTMLLDTACSSSLVAVHQACQSLKLNECEMALAGGVSLMISPLGTALGCKLNALSIDGRSRSFDATANGYGRGEGAGVLVLKRLKDAIINKDPILAVISGSAINHDGRSTGLTAPNGRSQRELLKKAIAQANISSEQISYIEAHATGTVLGDPIELNSIIDVFSQVSRSTPLFLGSIKPNIGHLEAAAGIASMIKIILMLHKKILPAQLHFNRFNPHLEQYPAWLMVPRENQTWHAEQYYAGISSFGLSGTNAHIIVKEPPSISKNNSEVKSYLLPISARNLVNLTELVGRYLKYFQDSDPKDFTDICYTACIGRKHMPARLLFEFTTKFEIVEQLSDWLNKPTLLIQQTNDLIIKTFLNGEDVDWSRYFTEGNFQKMVLPTYPFQKERFWIGKKTSPFHPLLGELISLPLSKIQYHNQLDLRSVSLAFLQDHCLNMTPIFPGAAFIEIMLAAGRIHFGQVPIKIVHFQIKKPLFFSSLLSKIIMVVLELQDDSYLIHIYSQNENDWTEHALGQILKADEKLGLKIPLGQKISGEPYVYQSSELSLTYGPAFQLLKTIDFYGLNQAVGEVVVHQSDDEFCFHPAMLDSCLQVAKSFLTEQTSNCFLPTGFAKFIFIGSPDSKLFSHVTLNQHKSNEKILYFNVEIYNQLHHLVAIIIDLSLHQVDINLFLKHQSLAPKNVLNLVSKSEWFPCALPKWTRSSLNSQFYLIFGEDDQLTSALYSTIRDQGNDCLVINRSQFDQNDWSMHLPNCQGIFFLWSLFAIDDLNFSVLETAVYLLRSVANDKVNSNFIFTIVSSIQNYPQQAALGGVIRTFHLENPNLDCLCVSLDEHDSPEINAHRLFSENQFYKVEKQMHISYHSGQRWKKQIITVFPHKISTISPDNPVQLHYSKKGLLSDLEWRFFQLPILLENQLLIEVSYVGLNFKDVLLALNSLESNHQEYGFEFSGIIKSKHQNNNEFDIGDRVLGFAPHQKIANLAVVSVNKILKISSMVSLESAATLPIAMLTAYQALFGSKQLKSGDKILIHAAAGGVGLAAVELALSVGAEVFATAHPNKWPLLRSKGIRYLMNSRSLEYSEQIKLYTQGQGVDWLINSFGADYIYKNLEILKPNGVYIEIGQRQILTSDQIHLIRPDIDYQVLNLSPMLHREDDWIVKTLKQVLEKIATQQIEPLPYQLFAANQVKNAFQYMAQAKHKGKILIQMESKRNQFQLKPEASYLVTGATGGLGRLTVEFLINKGAKHIIILGRNIHAPQHKDLLQKWQQLGVAIYTFEADVADFTTLQKIFNQIALKGLILKGVIHAAGILKDGVFIHQNWSDFLEIFQTKAYGTYYLNQLTADMPLDFFICYSSIAAVLGSPGQANYAAANAFMDACVQQRYLKGLPALTIHWGPWQAGMIESMNVQNKNRLFRSGFNFLKPEEAFEALEIVFNLQDDYQYIIASMDWQKYGQYHNNTSINKLTHSDFLQSVLQLNDKEQQFALLVEQLKHLLGQILDIPVNKITHNCLFSELGMDSLMAIEFSNAIADTLKFTISPEKLSAVNNIASLASAIL